MLEVAFKMLIGDKAKFLGLLFGIFLSSFLICQQTSIFLGLVERSYRIISDAPTAEIWVMDPGTENVDKVYQMSDANLDRVKSIPGVLWAAPLSSNYFPLKLPNGLFQVAQVVGIDAQSLIGAPQYMIQGNAEGLRRDGGAIVDQHAIQDPLVSKDEKGNPVYLKLGDDFDILDQRFVLVGVAKLTLGFYPQPVVYVSYEKYKELYPDANNHLGFILVRARPGEDVDQVIQRIKNETGLSAYTREDFKWRSIQYFLRSGILMNFGTTVVSGFLLGVAIVGIMFHMLTIDYLPYFAMLRAIGADNSTITRMIFFQAFISGIIGFGLGVGAASFAGKLIILSQSSIAFLFPPLVLLVAAVTVVLICLISAWLCIKRILKEDPKSVMAK